MPYFRNYEHVPIGWFFLFSPENIITRQEANMEGILSLDNMDTDTDTFLNLADIMEEPVMFITSLPEAKKRLSKLRDMFSNFPYIWSYFRIIDILDTHIEDFIKKLQEIPVKKEVRLEKYPDEPRSQVKIEGDDFDFSELLAEFDNEKENTITESKDIKDDSAEMIDTLSELSALEDMFSEKKDKPKTTIKSMDDEELAELLVNDDVIGTTTIIEDESEKFVYPIYVDFSSIAGKGIGKRLQQVLKHIETLYRYAKREGKLTRIMLDVMQDIFRESLSNWKITGQLAEDFIESDPSNLPKIMLGVPSPMVIINETFDLEYWTRGTLQAGDERLMYTLTMLPSERIHIALNNGQLSEIATYIPNLLLSTRSIKPPVLSEKNLKMKPFESNIWGFRVMINHNNEPKAATLLCASPTISWEEDFKKRLNLPGVYNDWYIDYEVRFTQFNDTDNYQVIFKQARDIIDTFEGFIRWARRHNLIYRMHFGVEGTITKLKQQLIDTMDKEEGLLIFNILTNLTELGFSEATNALSDEAVYKKLEWLYS